MAEMDPPSGGAGHHPPMPSVRTSSLPMAAAPMPQPRSITAQAVVHQAPSQQPQIQQSQPQQQQHLQPQVIVATGGGGGAVVVPQQPSSNNQIYNPSPNPTAAAVATANLPGNAVPIGGNTGLLSGPRIVVLHRHNGDFGFTLRHFIVYPPPEATTDPNTDRLAAAAGMPNFAQPMDTVFVKKVHPNSPAFLAGLQEGDRLLAVNGLSVASLPYAQVVATIQQTPKTLTLQVVPKNYDLLQTYFSETAYNPETNQRPQPQQLFIPKASSTPNSRSSIASGGGGSVGVGVKRVLTDQEKQESLYSTLQEIVENAAANKAIYAEVPKIRSPPMAAEAPQSLQQQQQQRSTVAKPLVFDFDPAKQQHYLAQQQQQKPLQHSKDSDSISSYDSVKSAATLSANDVQLMGGGDSAIMSRLRKSFEQKEEFLRRPAPAPSSAGAQPSVAAPFDVQQREFYGRPNRLQKSVWPPPPVQQQQPPPSITTMPVITSNEHHPQDSLSKPSKMSSGTQTAVPTVPAKPIPSSGSSLATVREQHSSHLSAIREQFFSGINGLAFSEAPPKSAPPSLAFQREQQQQHQLSGSQSALPLSPQSMHVVSEKAKLFESGRPLSPDGVDRAELYKSELSRINTKQVVANVAVRRKEFELKAESTGWRRSTEEKPRSVSSDSDSRRTPIRVRSLSVESTHTKDLSAAATALATSGSSDDQQVLASKEPTAAPGVCTLLRQRPVRENSYRNAVRNSTAFWLQGPATSGAFVPPPSALMISPPSSAPPTQSHSSFPFSPSSLNPPSTLAPVPPVRTYAAAHHRLHPLSEEQFKLRMLHRNQTIVEVHSQPPTSLAEAIDGGGSIGAISNSSSDEGGMVGRGAGGGGVASADSDVDMKPATSTQITGLGATVPSTTTASIIGGMSAPAPSTAATPTAAVRPTTLNLCSDSSQVVLRQKHHHHQLPSSSSALAIEEDERKTRRISYLRATAHENLFQMMESSDPSDSSPMSLPPDTPDTEPEANVGDIPSQQAQQLQQQQQQQQSQQALSLVASQPQQLKSHSAKSKALAHFRDSPADPSVPVLREGELNIKVTLIDGKRSQDRSWRTVHAELRGNRLRLTLLRDTGKASSQSPEPSGIIDLTNFHVAEGNYTKRKNVFKLTTVGGYPNPHLQQQHHHPHQLHPFAMMGGGGPTAAQSHQHLAVHHTQSAGLSSVGPSSGSPSLYKGYERELLLQADSHNDMRLWMDSLRTVCRSSQYLNSSDYINNLGGQQAEPQRVAALTSVQSTSNDEFSPVLSAKSHRKYALGSRSPSGQSPVTKSRKTPQQSSVAVLTPAAVSSGNQSHSGKESSDKETGSPKSKTWKGIVARQFRKMQGQPGSPGAQNAEMLLPDGASINVPLQLCPPSDENPYVPLLLAKCTNIVESRGLGVIGIYRIPGNTAAISQLTEQVNRGMDEVTLRDPKWDDVNVVSSLLKSFIRNLPEPLLPNEMYHSFINADKLTGQQRLIELRQLLHRIPAYNYETLKHLMRHLNIVSTNAQVNLMDPRNLAIVFGPSVVRSANESLETAVKDMKHQCQIVEVLINHYSYFFEDDLLPSVVEKPSTTTVDCGLDVPSASLLLDNVSKIEPFKESSKESSSHFVAQIVQAANRKIRRTAQRKSTMSSTTPDTLSLDSTTSAESKEQSSRSSSQQHHHHHRYLHPSSAGPVPVADHNQSPPDPAASPGVHSDDSQKENLVHQQQQQYYHHRHHHQQQQQQQQQHHFYHHVRGEPGGLGGNRHHSTTSQSNDDNSSVLNRSSEDDSNDSAFADNGSMSLNTITIALDNKLRSLRNSSIDSDRDVVDTTLESDCDNSSSCYSAGGPLGANSTPTRRSVHHSRPLTLGENIPYADESPERPLIQTRSKPLRQHNSSNNNGNFPKATVDSSSNSNLINNNSSGNGNADDSVKSAQSQKSIDSGGTTTNSNDSCVTLVNEDDDEDDKVNNISLSSDDTDTSTTSNPREKLTSTYRIDTEVLKKMNRILTNLERKANNLERKFNLNRSLSLNYKNHKNLECCCGHAVPTAATGAVIPCCHNNNNNLHGHQNQNSIPSVVSMNNSLNLRSRLMLTKDEKTDKNINRRRQIHDISQTVPASGTEAGACCGAGPQIILTPTTAAVNPSAPSGRTRRQMGNRSIRRRHTVGGTHDYYSTGTAAGNKHSGAGHNGCPQQQQLQQGGTRVIGACGTGAVPQQGVRGGDEKEV
ncbi:uncharacterized protein LOC5573415 isoform X2 [Aedes aegypti]|uniref:Uncharacterized protein n=1 Tax=Aedes aegypti TaxID=7159 RepID=A0A6I8TY51_AEDAE|nr:uncharacterized protein LOC5573415 isoform X2 [Aedes aegypti]